MKRVLQVVDSMDMGGIQAFIMNVYRNIDKENIQFDFLVFRSHEQVFEKEILSLGGKMYKLPGRRDGLLKNKKAIRKFFDEHPEYTVIHYNTSSLSDIGALIEAARRNIPVRIIHSHSTKAPGSKIHTYIHRFNKRRIEKYATHYLACGKLAADWFYKGTSIIDKVIIVNNGIACSDFQFDAENREIMRKALGLQENFVIGHVGRFSEVKNHRFILQVFNAFVKKYPAMNPKLMLVGNGELFDEMKTLAVELNIDYNVLFLGTRHDIPDLLQAMDVMIMPSHYEGFPVTLVEAQAAGLPCVVSNTITKDAVIKDNVIMKSLEDDVEDWSKSIAENTNRFVENDLLVKSGFDIQSTVNQLITIYGFRR